MAHTPWFQETSRLTITEFTSLDWAHELHLLSMDEDNRRFVPDEVFETDDAARTVITNIQQWYEGNDEPLVYPLLLKSDDTLIGYVQAAPLGEGEWEIGYHIGMGYTGHGYATEAARAFAPAIMHHLQIEQLHGECLADNIASQHVLEKTGFTLQYKGIGLYQGVERPICRYLLRLPQSED